MTPIRNPADYQARLAALQARLSDLERYHATVSADALRDDSDTQNMVLHAFFVAAQAAIDIALSVCASEGLAATSYREAFVALRNAGLIDRELAAAMEDWASFRNIVAHFYPVLDLDRVHQALGELGPLHRFVAWATTQLERQ